MINTVIQLTHSVDMETISRMFVKYKGRYGGLWTCRAGSDQEWQWVMEDWLEELNRFSLDVLRAAFKKSLTEFTTAPPTLPQLVELCLKESGVPSKQEIIRLMIARNFNHPLVKMVYDKIGSWTLNNSKSEEIDKKVNEYYAEARSSFHAEPEKAWAQLEAYNARPKELPPPSKIPSATESKAFRECMNKCQEILKGKNIPSGGKTYKHFEENKINERHREFDQAVFNEYKKYLMEIPEEETMILPPHYVYARNKFLNARDQKAWLLEQGYVPRAERSQQEERNFGTQKAQPTKVYKNWMSD